MNLTLAHVGARPGAKDAFDALAQVYLERCSAFAQCRSEAFKSEDALLDWLSRQQGRTPVIAVLLDSRGRQMTSEAFAAWLGTRRDEGAQHIVFAIGPANGWSQPARDRAAMPKPSRRKTPSSTGSAASRAAPPSSPSSSTAEAAR